MLQKFLALVALAFAVWIGAQAYSVIATVRAQIVAAHVSK